MDLLTIQVVFWLLLGAVVVMAYELKESLKAPVCRECPHCLARIEEQRRRDAESRDFFARTVDEDRDDNRRR